MITPSSVTLVASDGSSVEIPRQVNRGAGGTYGLLLKRVESHPAPRVGEIRKRSRAAGAHVGTHQAGARTWQLTVQLMARNTTEARMFYDGLVSWLDDQTDPLTMEWVEGSTPVEAEVVWTGPQQVGAAPPKNWQEAVLSFTAGDPYVYEQQVRSVSVTSGGVSAVNGGQTKTWGTWVVEGPASGTLTGIELSDGTDSIILTDLSLGSGDSITVETEPGYERIVDGSGASLMNKRDVAGGSRFFPLRRGTQTLSYTATGAAPSTVTFSWRNRSA